MLYIRAVDICDKASSVRQQITKPRKFLYLDVDWNQPRDSFGWYRPDVYF